MQRMPLSVLTVQSAQCIYRAINGEALNGSKHACVWERKDSENDSEA